MYVCSVRNKLYHLRKKVNVHISFVMQSLADIMLTLSLKTMPLCKHKQNIVVSDNNIFIQHYSFLHIIMTCRFYILDIPSNLMVSVGGRLNLTLKGRFFFFFLIVLITTFFIYGSVQKLQFMHDRHRKADGQCLLIGLFFKGIIYQLYQ